MKSLPVIFLLVALLLGCGRQTTTITDVTVPQTLVLKKRPSQNLIHGIEILGHGTIEGRAKLILLLDSESYREETLSGKIDFQWSGDWYTDQAELLFEPGTATSGTIHLRYRFRD